DIAIQPVIDPEIIKEDLAEEIDPANLRLEVLSGNRCWSGNGKMIHSSFEGFSIDGLSIEKAKEAVIERLEKTKSGEKAITYKLRDWLFSRQRYWGEPFPILHFEDGTKRVLDVSELPLTPPELVDYKPSPTGESPLAR